MPASRADPVPAVRLAGVCAAYGRRQVLSGLSLSIAPGEAYALLGPNGAGKSTAARVVCGLMKPSAGSVAFAQGRTAAGRRRQVGLAPQDCALFSALTVRENLHVMARAGGVSRERRPGAVDRALDLARCTERADEPVKTLSGGWRRRANLAAALVCQPPLLVLDEPTEGVDAATREALSQAIRSSLADGGACLLISHDAAFVEAVADRVGILAQGRLVADGPPAHLIRKTFGASERLMVSFAMEPAPSLRAALADRGLDPGPNAVTWTRIAGDVEAVSSSLLEAVKAAGGEVSIRRPNLDDLVSRITGRPI